MKVNNSFDLNSAMFVSLSLKIITSIKKLPSVDFISRSKWAIEFRKSIIKSRRNLFLGFRTDFSFEPKNDSVAISFRVKDVHEACEYLKAKNVEIVSPPCSFADLGVTAALARDPDGNLIELTQMGDMVGADSNG